MTRIPSARGPPSGATAIVASRPGPGASGDVDVQVLIWDRPLPGLPGAIIAVGFGPLCAIAAGTLHDGEQRLARQLTPRGRLRHEQAASEQRPPAQAGQRRAVAAAG
jgi:hypothetical protein